MMMEYRQQNNNDDNDDNDNDDDNEDKNDSDNNNHTQNTIIIKMTINYLLVNFVIRGIVPNKRNILVLNIRKLIDVFRHRFWFFHFISAQINKKIIYF